MNTYVLDKRHSETNGMCDAHNGYVGSNRAVSKLLTKDANGTIMVIRLCRACARALARNASRKGDR